MSEPKNSMGKEVVLTRLRAWFQYYRISEGILEQDKQAYTQLVEIVEGHFLDPGVKTEILAQEYEKGLQDGYEHAKKELADPVENNKTDTQEGEDEGYLLSEFDNLYASAHDGYLPTDEEFECELEHCPQLYLQIKHILTQQPQKRVDEEEQEQPPMDKETAGDKKFHELKDEDRLDGFGRRK